MKRTLMALVIAALFIIPQTAFVSAASKGDFPLPVKSVKYSLQNDKWVKVETDTVKYNSKGDIISSANIAGKAKTTYWKGSRIRKSVVWTGRGYGSKDIATYDKKGHLKECRIRSDVYNKTTRYKYSKGWISKAGSDSIKRTFYGNGMIKSSKFYQETVYYSNKGLITRILRPYEQYGTDVTVRYDFDKKGNVTTAWIKCNDPGYTSEEKIVFTYSKKLKVNRRTQSAWINHLSHLWTEQHIFDDVLGICS